MAKIRHTRCKMLSFSPQHQSHHPLCTSPPPPENLSWLAHPGCLHSGLSITGLGLKSLADPQPSFPSPEISSIGTIACPFWSSQHLALTCSWHSEDSCCMADRENELKNKAMEEWAKCPELSARKGPAKAKDSQGW